MDLPSELAQQFETQLHDYEQKKQMPYITTWERRGIEKGREEGSRETLLETIAFGFEQKFGEDGKSLIPVVESVSDLDQLRTIYQALWKADSLDEIKSLLPAPPSS